MQILRARFEIHGNLTPLTGMSLALLGRMNRMRLEDVRAWRLAHAFTQHVCALLKGSAVAAADMRFSVQLFRTARSAEASVADGFRQGSDEASARHLADAGHALAAALVAIEDGIDRGYFLRRPSQSVLEAGRETARTVKSLQAYLERCAQQRRDGRMRSG